MQGIFKGKHKENTTLKNNLKSENILSFNQLINQVYLIEVLQEVLLIFFLIILFFAHLHKYSYFLYFLFYNQLVSINKDFQYTKLDMMTIEQDFIQVQQKQAELTHQIQLSFANVTNFTVINGPTGSGKSTLTNYLHQAKLAYTTVPGGKYQIYHTQNPQNFPKIGHQKKSCTQIPNICTQNGGCTIDLVGWFDTNDVLHEIVNAFGNASVLKKGKKIKIALVCEVDTLKAQRGGRLVEMIEILTKTFKFDLQQVKNSTMVVFSKVKQKQGYDIQLIKNNVKQIIAENQNFTEDLKSFLNTLISNDMLQMFPTPDSENFANHIQSIKAKLKSVKEVTLTHDAQVTLSNQTIHLKDVLQSRLKQNSWSINKQYQQIFQDKFSPQKFTNSSLIDAPLNSLKGLQGLVANMFNSNGNSQVWISHLTNFNNSLKVSSQIADKALTHIKLIKFCIKLNQNQKFQEYLKFVQILKLSVTQVIKDLQHKKTQLQNAQKKKILEEKLKQEKIKQEADALKLRQQAQARQKLEQQQREYATNLIQQQLLRQQAYQSNLHNQQLQHMSQQIQNLRRG